MNDCFWGSDHDRLIILERPRYKNLDHLRQCDLRGAMGRVRHCSDRESGVAGRALELGASTATATQDSRMGIVSADRGRAVDLGILLDGAWALGGIGQHCGLDSPCGEQLVYHQRSLHRVSGCPKSPPAQLGFDLVTAVQSIDVSGSLVRPSALPPAALILLGLSSAGTLLWRRNRREPEEW